MQSYRCKFRGRIWTALGLAHLPQVQNKQTKTNKIVEILGEKVFKVYRGCLDRTADQTDITERCGGNRTFLAQKKVCGKTLVCEK